MKEAIVSLYEPGAKKIGYLPIPIDSCCSGALKFCISFVVQQFIHFVNKGIYISLRYFFWNTFFVHAINSSLTNVCTVESLVIILSHNMAYLTWESSTDFNGLNG
jgi:hypothetical protein